MVKIMKDESTFSFIEERDWFLGELSLREIVIEERNETHYSNGLVTKHTNKYYIRLNSRREVCSGQVSQNGVIREMSVQRCMDVMNSVDWSIY